MGNIQNGNIDRMLTRLSVIDSEEEYHILKCLDNITHLELDCSWGVHTGHMSISGNVADGEVSIDLHSHDFDELPPKLNGPDDVNCDKSFSKTKQSLVDILKEVKIQNWHEDYSPADFFVCDGIMWNLTIKCGTEEFHFEGSDIFPDTMPILFDYFGIKLDKLFKDFDYELYPVA